MRKPNVSYFRVFSCKCFVLNMKDNLDKFDAKSYEVIFVWYSNTSKAYTVFIRTTLTIEESMHVKFEESNSFVKNIVDSQIEFAGEDLEWIYSRIHLPKKIIKKKSKLNKHKEKNMRKPKYYLKIGG